MPQVPVFEEEAPARVNLYETGREANRDKAEPIHYREHSVASGYWGDIPVARRPLRVPKAEEAQETFLRGMLDTPTEKGRRNPLDWLVSVAIHVIVMAALVIVPLLFTDVLDLRNIQVTFLAVPRPPAAAPAPKPTAIQKVVRPVRVFSAAKLTAPVAIPKRVVIAKDELAPDVEQGGAVGGIPGGESGGVLGGILGGTGAGQPAPPPPTVKEKPTIHRVGGDVKPPQIVLHVDPKYPVIARQARIEGIVNVDAVIDENGNVVQVHAIDGPGLLIASALEAVMQWKYQPTLLNGERVPIAMHVQVIYHLQAHTAG